MFLRISLLHCFLCLALTGLTQSVWELNKEKKGIRVYTRKADSSSFKSIKVEGVFEGSWEKLSSILMDINGLGKWVYRTKHAYVLKRITNNEVVYYTETSLPWPTTNRDAVVRMKLYFDRVHNINKVLSVGEPDVVPVKSGLIRITYYKAEWEVKAMGKNKIAITYFLNVHPGGKMPSWVVNMFITTGPYETFEKLAELLKK